MTVPSGFTQRFKGKLIVNGGGSLFGFGRGIGAAMGPQGNLFKFAGAQGNGADTSEDVLSTFSLPANSLDVVGRALWLYAFGTMTATGTKTGRLYFGSELVSTGGIVATAESWALEMLVIKSGASAQVISSQLVNGGTHGGVANQTGAETDTAAIAIKVTGQNSAATANGIVLEGFMITAMD